jgi:hypothetical protein
VGPYSYGRTGHFVGPSGHATRYVRGYGYYGGGFYYRSWR